MIRWPAEWEKHTAILMVWPHEHSDWRPRLDAVRKTYIEIMRNILRFERMLVIVPDAQEERRIRERLGETKKEVTFCQIPTDDTWTRDSGPVTVFLDGEPLLLNQKMEELTFLHYSFPASGGGAACGSYWSSSYNPSRPHAGCIAYAMQFINNSRTTWAIESAMRRESGLSVRAVCP